VKYSHLYNSNPFKAVTLLIDGKDFVTALTELKNEKRLTKKGKSTLTSYKNNFKNGGKVVFLDDSRMMPIAISKMVGANEAYDGHLMKSMKIHKVMHPEFDNLIYDHHFDRACEDIIEISESKNIALNATNFTPSIRKLPGQSFSPDELQYNKQHGSYRSLQETARNAALVNTFKRFSPNCKMRCRSFDVLLLQMKVCIVLYSISKHQTKNELMRKRQHAALEPPPVIEEFELLESDEYEDITLDESDDDENNISIAMPSRFVVKFD
jgi:hypothetical protein